MSQSDSSPTKNPKLEDGLGNGKSHNEISAVGIREEKDNEVENDDMVKNKSPHYDPFENGCGSPSFSDSPPYHYPPSPIYNPTYPGCFFSSYYSHTYPCYFPASTNYCPNHPDYIPTSPSYYPTFPYHSPTSPDHNPYSSDYSPTTPDQNPISPDHSPQSLTYSPGSPPKNYGYGPVDMEAENKTSDHLKEIGNQSNHVIGGNYHEAEATRIIHVPCSKVALLVGAVATLRFLQHNLCARIRILNDSEVDLKSALRPVELTGPVLQIELAQQLIDSVLAEENHDEHMEEETKKPSSHIEQVHAASEHSTCDAATSPRT